MLPIHVQFIFYGHTLMNLPEFMICGKFWVDFPQLEQKMRILKSFYNENYTQNYRHESK